MAIEGSEEIIGTINELRRMDKFDYTVRTRDWHPRDHISF